jgi:cytochrome c oxidase subunit 2
MQFELVAVSPDKFKTYLDAKKGGATTQEAMAAIGFSGKAAYAEKTEPLNTRRHADSWNQSNPVAGN